MSAAALSAPSYHHAPAARFPLRRSAAVGYFLICVVLGGAGVLLSWWGFGAPAGWAPVAAGLGLWVATSLLAAHAWRISPIGEIDWDGAQWWFAAAPGMTPIAMRSAPSVHLDLQGFLLISMRPYEGRLIWLALEETQAPLEWAAFRRAVYSRARTSGGPAVIGGAGGTPSS